MSNFLYLLSQLDFISVIDILLVTLVFYWVLRVIQGTQAVQLLRGTFFLLILIVISATAFDSLIAFSWLIDKTFPALLVAIPVIFQTELRRALERVGRTGKLFTVHSPPDQTETMIQTLSVTAVSLSRLRHGALIILERETGLEEYIETGVRIDATVSIDLLRTIFFPSTALHDGAVVIRNDRVVAASVILPLAESVSIDNHTLGTRHRASLGISTITDALAIIVSEETGVISVARDGQLLRNLDQKQLENMLLASYKPQLDTPFWQNTRQTVFKRLRTEKRPKSVTQAQSK
ncbi:MAG: diadenylate cyclase CdaA [Chloroflexota bacterium]